MMPDLRCYAILDPEHCRGRDLATLARAAADGGATILQLRDKRGTTRDMVARARAVVAALSGSGVPVLVNDRVDVALAAGADGVHVGQDDMLPSDARRLLGGRAIVGLTVKTEDQAMAIPIDLVDYVCIGGVFATVSKHNVDPPVGLDGLARIARRARALRADLPIGAIAGIRADNRRRRGGGDLGNLHGRGSAGGDGRAARGGRGSARGGRGDEDVTTKALTIAGSDSGGGAGIQADLKTFSALGVYGASVVTALTAQNTQGVTGVLDVPPDFVTAQIDAVFSDIGFDAVKIGMLSQAPVIRAVAAGLDRWGAKNVVLDPVMVATSGDVLLAPEAIATLRAVLLPSAALVTPNLAEAAKLTETAQATSREAMIAQGRALVAMGAKAVLVKGGHGEGAAAEDVLIVGDEVQWFSAIRHPTRNTHGTGCTLSSAIAAGMALGLDLAQAVRAGKAYLTAAIRTADRLGVGKGHGPVDHFHALWATRG